MKLGYPIIIKASMGGGGRGMRVVRDAPTSSKKPSSRRGTRPGPRSASPTSSSKSSYSERSTSRCNSSATGTAGSFTSSSAIARSSDDTRKWSNSPRRRIFPTTIRKGILDAAIAVGKACGIDNASTVEFLYDTDAKQFYFIEVNPRIQVEHTVTEQVTGFDIVRSQILIASGRKLADPAVGLEQSAIATHGFAIQCRVTTEDPSNGFVPDYGRLSAYRSSGGPGIRLDAGTAFGGAVITPFYDSLLVKVTASGLRFDEAAYRMERCLQEFRVRGVKTNIPFLINLVTHPKFLVGRSDDAVPRRNAGTFQPPDAARPRQQAARIHRGSDRQRASRDS